MREEFRLITDIASERASFEEFSRIIKEVLEKTEPLTYPHIEMALLSAVRDYGIRSIAQLYDEFTLRLERMRFNHGFKEPADLMRAENLRGDLRYVCKDHNVAWLEFQRTIKKDTPRFMRKVFLKI